MKKYKAKVEIMKIFEHYPDREMSSNDVFDAARNMGIFIPPAFNTHLSQLHKLDKLMKTKRGVYQLNQCYDEVEIYVNEQPLKQSNIFELV